MRKEDLEGDVYYGASCLTRYWIRDEEKKCIVHVDIPKTGQLDMNYYGPNYPWGKKAETKS